MSREAMRPRMVDPETTRALLHLLAQGRATHEILAEHPHFTASDIQAAAADALRVLEKGETRNDRIARIRRAHPHAFEPWTQKEDDDLLAEWRHGATVAALSRAFGRPLGAIRMRLQKLGQSPRRGTTTA